MLIDLVYLWVDGNDLDWVAKRDKYLVNNDCSEEAINLCRFSDNEELKYSLRSVELNASWINKIYIVTDKQVPTWLNTSHPKIRIVDHEEIVPKEKLPLFNSCAIESRIPYIEGLSENFLYANDDTYFWKPVSEDFFYKNEKPICRALKFLKRNKTYSGFYTKTILEAYKRIGVKYNPSFYAFLPHHNVDAYKKSTFINCLNKFESDFEKTLDHRFRDEKDVQRILVTYFSLVNNEAYLKVVKRNIYEKFFRLESDSEFINIKARSIGRISKVNAKLLCLNDNFDTKEEDRRRVKEILEKKFSKKSSFEK